MRWFVCLVGLVQLAYRPRFWFPTDMEFVFLLLPVMAFNGLVHYRLHRGRTVTWRWLLFLSAMDVALITAGVVIGGDFHMFAYVAYFPALALFAAVFSSLGLCLAWTTVVAALYSAVSLGVIGLDLEAGHEKALLARVAAMYAIISGVSLIVRFERNRRREAAERERELLRGRIELSQAIHDTAAQTAYMISMGLHRATRLAGESNRELASTLAATSALARTAIWELRSPIDEGGIFEGRNLSRVLWSHTETFGRVLSIPAEMVQTGTEIPLSPETSTGLFSVAHNALTNAFLHARAARIEVRLEFGEDRIRLSVSDDGIGLPDDYGGRGRGFHGMSAQAERLGGRLIVESDGAGRGTTVTCEIPYV